MWGCCAVMGAGQLAINEGTVTSVLLQRIFKEHICSSVYDLRLKHDWVLQQSNNPKQISKAISEGQKKMNIIAVLEWPCKSPDSNREALAGPQMSS